ncbi:hypothetical protein [Marinilabilia rubra]|uniref:hypothetical protein n=1 Tax=Marinilabilia rubra TaxID=2162893 RepID=UPI0011B1E33A|nr:hypothetical protein [Marinilabilia rubra]
MIMPGTKVSLTDAGSEMENVGRIVKSNEEISLLWGVEAFEKESRERSERCRSGNGGREKS